MELAGNNLDHSKISRMTNLLRGQVEGTLTGLGVGEFDFRVHFASLDLANQPLRTVRIRHSSGIQKFDGDVAAETEIARAIHIAHATCPE